MKVYRVGGAVRDRLLGIPVQDQDWVVIGETPESMAAQGFRPVGGDFPVFIHPQTGEEYALARTERKSGRGYKGFSFNTSPEVTLEEDLRRRDLTINAMAEDADGNIIDPFGGKSDLRGKILRHVSPAFAEDPLRVLRVARFAARFPFTVAAETIELMRAITSSGELSELVAERVWTETERALSEHHAVRYFEVLRECGALIVIFPEIAALFGVPQPEKYHPEIDSGLHTFMVLEQCCALTPDGVIRFAALVHDLGKGTTPPEFWPGHRGHEERSVDLINALCDRYRIPNRFRELAVIVARHHPDCHRVGELKPATIVRKLEALDAFRRPERFEQFLVACEADARGRKGLENHPYPQAAMFRAALAAARRAGTEGLDGSKMSGTAIAAALHERRAREVEAWKRAIEES
jgi:tRNA nucleotidyltransferase (CCA-adding enzyme)